MKTIKRNQLSLAVLVILQPSAKTVDFIVIETLDDGTGLVSGSLSWSILQANITPGPDKIELQANVTITGVITLG